MTILDCGCDFGWIRNDDDSLNTYLVYCPLHTAAPDLLEFVQWTVNFYELMEKIGDLSEDERPILEAARAAIAKATGKEA